MPSSPTCAIFCRRLADALERFTRSRHSAWQVVAAALVLLGISFLAVPCRSHPYVAVGWFWYLGTLVRLLDGPKWGSIRADRTFTSAVGYLS